MNGTALDAVEQGCSQCEKDQCDGTVGYGGSPDEDGETTLDALIIDGTKICGLQLDKGPETNNTSPSYSMGAVGDLRRVKHAISVARAVMERSTHTFLVGEKATQFAVEMGFQEESLTTNHSKQMWTEWKANNCQPNYRQNVAPDPRTSCGPYQPSEQLSPDRDACPSAASELNHDTIGMVVIDTNKRLAAGTSTNGMNHKIPGRIGDSPIPGAGAYADQEVGGAAATGDGDILMRYLPSFHAVESMRRGIDPRAASVAALHLIVRHHPKFVGALVAVSIDGTYGAACHGIPSFPYSVAKPEYGTAVVEHVECTN
ncbi:N(4)-(Beta-N-acetylglucosaminyl)-L-asparaginase isoform X3 [Rhipicephalus microplus]